MFNNTRISKSIKPDGYTHEKERARTGREEDRADPLSYAHIRPRFEYVEGASVLKSTKGISLPAIGGGIRGTIRGFSRNSRSRLLKLIGSIRRNSESPIFVTLTYPCKFPDVARAKRDLKIFCQRLIRRFGVGVIWKLEPQERGAPHFHLLVWGVGESELLDWVVENWFTIAGDGDLNHKLFHSGQLHDSKPCVQRVRSFKGVWFYAAKYLGKTFEVAEWGKKWVGRFWGVLNPEKIPFGENKELPAELGQVVEIMRYQRRFSGIRARKSTLMSITTFCDVDQWVKRLILTQRN